jgi:hypothetical protein
MCKQHSARGYSISFSPAIIAKINSWGRIANCRMLTSWTADDLKELAPRIGLDIFPVLPYIKDDFKAPSKIDLAVEVMKEIGPDRLLIHIDDELRRWVGIRDDIEKNKNTTEVSYFNRPNTLLMSPKDGLTFEQAELIDNMLKNPEMWKGKSLYELEKR